MNELMYSTLTTECSKISSVGIFSTLIQRQEFLFGKKGAPSMIQNFFSYNNREYLKSYFMNIGHNLEKMFENVTKF